MFILTRLQFFELLVKFRAHWGNALNSCILILSIFNLIGVYWSTSLSRYQQHRLLVPVIVETFVFLALAEAVLQAMESAEIERKLRKNFFQEFSMHANAVLHIQWSVMEFKLTLRSFFVPIAICYFLPIKFAYLSRERPQRTDKTIFRRVWNALSCPKKKHGI